MPDPDEGLDPHGIITTGVRLSRIPGTFQPILDAAISAVALSSLASARDSQNGAVELHLYGSVATGMATPGRSDVDLLTIGLPTDTAATISRDLSLLFAPLCRGVEIGAAQPGDYVGAGDVAYGNSVFLRHYCVPLWGPDAVRSERVFAGDARAARGFNGDIGLHLERWRQVQVQVPASVLGRRIARKSLLAVAGLVSVHDGTWTTDRGSSAERWGELHPHQASALNELVTWSTDSADVSPWDVHASLRPDGIVSAIVNDFAASIGLLPE